jgi:hypothetical protein
MTRETAPNDGDAEDDDEQRRMRAHPDAEQTVKTGALIDQGVDAGTARGKGHGGRLYVVLPLAVQLQPIDLILGGKSMRRPIVAALLVTLFPTMDAWAQNIDWGQKSRSLDTGMSEELVMKTVGHSPNEVGVAVCSGIYGLPTGPTMCKIHTYGNKNKELIVRFKNENGIWLSYSWNVTP